MTNPSAPNDHRLAVTEDHEQIHRLLSSAATTPSSRRSLLARAGATVGALGAGALITRPGTASAGTAESSTGASAEGWDLPAVLRVLTSVEAFGVTLLTAAVKRAPGTPSAKFVGILRAANSAEYDHYCALRRIGGRPLSERIWIPDAVFGGGGIGLFRSIEVEETIEISAYLVGVTAFTHSRADFGARLCAEALGTESEHRTLARSAISMIAHNPAFVPNNKGFESYPYRSAESALHAHEALGIRYGTRGQQPGRFYDFPGDPRRTGTGGPIVEHEPA